MNTLVYALRGKEEASHIRSCLMVAGFTENAIRIEPVPPSLAEDIYQVTVVNNEVRLLDFAQDVIERHGGQLVDT